MDKKILVLGANSYLGKQYIKSLENCTVIGVVRKIDSLEMGINLKYITEIITNFKKINLLEIIKKYKPELIINFIGLSRVENTQDDNFENFYIANCQITVNLLDVVNLVKNYSPKIILLGSAVEYGVSNNLRRCVYNESSPTFPLSYYGITKKIQTELGLYYSRVFGQKIIIVRPSTIIGPYMKKGMFFSDVMDQLKKGARKIFVGDLSSTRDFIGIYDFITYLNKLTSLDIKDGIINLSSGKGVKLKRIASIITELFYKKFGKKIEFIESKNNLSFRLNHSILNNSKLMEYTKYQPEKKLKKVISTIIEEEFSYLN